jgi:hypothetical protein
MPHNQAALDQHDANTGLDQAALLMDPLPPARAALIAAYQATEAAAALLSLVREADDYPSPPTLDPEAEVIEKLAEATMRAIEIAHPDFEDEQMRQLHGALTRFLEGWA